MLSEQQEEEKDEDGHVCCNFHDKIELPKVTKLVFKLFQELCDECFDTMLDSFPNIKYLELTMAVNSDQFAGLIKKYPKLKGLKLFCGKVRRVSTPQSTVYYNNKVYFSLTRLLSCGPKSSPTIPHHTWTG